MCAVEACIVTDVNSVCLLFFSQSGSGNNILLINSANGVITIQTKLFQAT